MLDNIKNGTQDSSPGLPRRFTLTQPELDLNESQSGLTILTQANNAPTDERHIDLNMSQTFDKKNLSATR